MKSDLGALAGLTLFVLVCILLGLALAVMSHWLTLMFWHMGATEPPSAWVAYAVTAVCGLAVAFSVFGRVFVGTWFWSE